MTATPTRRLETIDPRNLRVGLNVRTDATPDAEMIRSVTEVGILQPPTVTITGDGEWEIVFGHRRANAAILAGLDTIDVLVIPQELAEQIRLRDQITENKLRANLSEAEIAGGYQQLQLFGVTPEEIASSLAEPIARVNAALRVAGSAKVSEVVQEAGLDLTIAAELVEFEDDKKTLKSLTEAAVAGKDLSWKLQQAREQRQRAAAKTDKLDELKAHRVPIVKAADFPAYLSLTEDRAGRRLEQLLTPAGNPLTPSKHKTCAGHAAFVEVPQWGSEVNVVYVCTDFEAHGHTVGSSRPTQTPEEYAEQAAREAKRQEQQAREHASISHRRAWVAELVQGPKINSLAGVYEFFAIAFTSDIDRTYSSYQAPVDRLTLELLQIDLPEATHQIVDTARGLAATGQHRPFKLLLAHAIAIHEASYLSAYFPGYLRRLQGWGYTPTDLELEQLARIETALAETSAAA